MTAFKQNTLEVRKMQKILVQLDSDPFASVFDAITAYDAGADLVLQYAGVTPEAVLNLVYGAIFTRGIEDLKNSAVFVGGSSVELGEKMLKVVKKAFLGPLQVSAMLDANGCNTTAAAAVAKLVSRGELAGKKVVVMAGTGPVGLRAAAMLAQEGAQVVISSRTPQRAEAACVSIQERFGLQVGTGAAFDEESTRNLLENACAVLCTGAAGITLVPESVWVEHPTLEVLADVNAVPPLGVEGIKPGWDGKERHGKVLFGALGIGGLKMKVHRTSVARLFEQNDLILDAEEIYAVARELIK
jgi:methylenetetrahydrofolate/methylenetetrahydromethanopterin dehydrogenase (NADP+)